MNTPVAVKGLNCPSCGAPLAVRGFAHTLNIACPNCLSILDAKDPNFRILQTAQEREKIQPRIPLGARGMLHGIEYEAIGFQERTITVDDLPYSWYEYLLFNPYRGFRYVTEYQGHWNEVTTLQSLPEEGGGARPYAYYGGTRFRHFQRAVAETTYIIGEFPWQVRVGDRVTVMDYVAPPRLLSREITPEETTWSIGAYLTGVEVWQAFRLPEQAPPAEGIFENQPSPYAGRTRGLWKAAGWAAVAWFVLLALVVALTGNEKVFEHTYRFSPSSTGEASFVTDTFELKGRPSTVEVQVGTDLENNWAYFHFALINTDTGEAYDFGREVSYYHGSDSDGSWNEGGRSDSALIPSVPAGRYYLFVEPEEDANAASVDYTLTVRRDVPSFAFFWIVLPLLFIPPIVTTIRGILFEQRRWQESDYASSSSGGSDD